MKYALFFALCLTSCAHAPAVSIKQETMKHGVRGAPCQRPPKMYGSMTILEKMCQYNEDKSMPSSCVYMGEVLEPNDILMVCASISVQSNCWSPWQPTRMVCSIPSDVDSGQESPHILP